MPTSGWGYKWGNGPAWDSAFLLIPFYLYEYCGDTKVLRDHYDGLKRYVDYLTSKAKDGIVDIGLNDWAPYKTTTPADITSTAYYYRDAQIVALAAGLMGNDADARKYTDLAASIKAGVQREVLPPRHRALRQWQPDLAQLRALPGPGRAGQQGARPQQPRRGSGARPTATLTPASSARNTS